MGAIASSIVQSVPRPAVLQGLRFNVRAAARLALAAALLLGGLASAWSVSDTAAQQVLQRVALAQRPSIVLVTACRPGGAPTDCRSATGFSIAPGLFLTVGHALLGAVQVTLGSATRGTAPAQVEQSDDVNDVVLLRSTLVLPSLAAATSAVSGERAIVVCSRRAIAADGLAGRPATYVGRVGGPPIRVDQGSRELLLERVAGAASVLGCSGSPVLNSRGAVTGVLVGGDGGSAGMVDVSDLDELIPG
jgi:hypothetical protein